MMATLSLRQRIPLEISVVVLVTGLCVDAVVLWHDYQTLCRDMQESSARLASTLVQALEPSIRVADPWGAYKTLRSLYQGAEPSWLLPSFLLVLDANGYTLAASDPVRFPMARKPNLNHLDSAEHACSFSNSLLASGQLTLIQPLTGSGTSLGALILAFDEAALWRRFREASLPVLSASLCVLAVMLALGWWLGRRIARPVQAIEQCVAQLGSDHGLPDACQQLHSGDELGRLRARVAQVATELREKRVLEAQVIRSERQAALGRLTAGVAHEINNPLSGMLTALATHKRHPRNATVVAETFALLERGLHQIRQVVSTLLVDVKATSRPLQPRDIDDIAELVAPQARARGLRMDWDNQLKGPLPLPASTVRQILLNLSLNAIQAAEASGAIAISAEGGDSDLILRVCNDGPAIAPERLTHLFEPFSESTSGGSGLGLWIIDQAVRQLAGVIDVRSEAGSTTFTIRLPLGRHQ